MFIRSESTFCNSRFQSTGENGDGTRTGQRLDSVRAPAILAPIPAAIPLVNEMRRSPAGFVEWGKIYWPGSHHARSVRLVGVDALRHRL